MPLSNKDNLLTQFKNIEPWEVTHELLQYLTLVANQSLTSPTDRKDKLFEQFLNTIYSGFFDTLDGGIIIDDKQINITSQNDGPCYFIDNDLCKSLSINVSMCRLLLAADQVFYHGEFRVLAKQIIDQIILTNKIIDHFSQTNQSEDTSLVIKNDYFFELSNSNISFAEQDISDALEPKELELFKALASEQSNTSNYLFLKKLSLDDACKKIKMHIKEGQIIEYSLVNKLRAINLAKAQPELLYKREITNCLINNCELIEACVESYHSVKDDKLGVHAYLLFNQLEEFYVKSDTIKTELEWIALICTSINLLSIEFTSSRLTTIINLIISHITMFNQTTLISQKHFDSSYRDEKFLYVVNFINSLPIDFEIPDNLIPFREQTSEIEKRFDFIFINAHAVDQQKKISQLRSKFNTFQTIIVHQ